ncbi:SH3 domain-containing protein [Paraclostridium bifermentans]|nr:SH3 domain-containing protein [Paraclostridium bifermentans]
MVYKGQSVTILESSNGWHKIKTQNGQIGWASSDYISTSGQGGGGSTETPSTGKGTVTASTLNIRSGPSTSNSIVGKSIQRKHCRYIK